jgi:hypothetical protein
MGNHHYCLAMIFPNIENLLLEFRSSQSTNAPNGSSNGSIFGRVAKARATPTRCFIRHPNVFSYRSLSGYRWGVERKQALLELEKLENS